MNVGGGSGGKATGKNIVWTMEGQKRTNLILDKPASKLTPCAFLLAFRPLHEDDVTAAGCLHVERTIHVGIAQSALQLWPGCRLGSPDSIRIVVLVWR